MRGALPLALALSLVARAHAEEAAGHSPDGGAVNPAGPLDGEGASRLSRKALARIKEGAWDEAADLLRRAHEKDPRNAAVTTDFAFALAHLGRREEAERMYRLAIDLDPNRFYAYANLGELWATDPMRWQRRDETVAFLEKAVASLAENARGQAYVELRLAELLRSLGRASDARARLQHLTAATTPPAVHRRALELISAVDAEAHERALDDWPAPEVSPADRHRLDKARATTDARAALGILDELVARLPAWIDARWQRARVLESLGQLDEASADLTVVVQLSPSHAEAWRRLGLLLAQHGGGFEAERADEALRHALALEPSWSDLRELRKQVAAKRARARKPQSERGSEPSPKARQLFQEAQSWMGMDAAEMAPPLLQQALAESPGFVEAAAALYAIDRAPPEATVKALWNDGQGLWQLALAVGALKSRDAATMASPWIDRAVELGVEEARFGRASLRAAAGDRAGALVDLRDYVAAEPAPPRLDEARALRTSLLTPAAPDSPERLIHLKLAEDRPTDALAALGGPCRPGLPFDNLLALGTVHEFAGDTQTAVGCYRAALDARPPAAPEKMRRASQRLASAASTLAASELGPLESYLAAAARAKVALASFSLARLAETRRQWDEAAAQSHAFLAEADRDDPRLGEARALQARVSNVVAKEVEQRSLQVERLRAVAVLLVLAGLGFFGLRRWRRKTLARALRAQPLLFPALARSIGRIRHDVLKHRTSSLELLADPATPRGDVARALLEPAPVSADVASIYDQVTQEARGLGVQLCPLAREPVIGSLAADLKKAETLIQRTDDVLPALHTIDERLRGLHLDRLQDLLRSGPRTVLTAGLLGRWIEGASRRGPAATTPGLYLQGAQIAFPLPRATLASIVGNLLRNAVAASDGGSGPAVEVRAEQGRDATGRRMVSLLVADACPQPLDVELIESRPPDRGLGIVRDATRAWGGEIIVREEAPPFRKSVGVRFPAPPEASP
jgi:tetratricopeptide (TPR) repeat protein